MKQRLFYILCFPVIGILRMFRRLSRLALTMDALSRVQECGLRVHFGKGLSVQNHGHISIGDGCEFADNVQLSTYSEGLLRIGRNCFVGEGVKVITDKGSVIIGDNCMIAEWVSIRASNHGVSRRALLRNQENVVFNISIGNDVWIGKGVTICAGAEVRSGCVIGANAVVTRSLLTEENCIYAGVPAKFIKRRI